MYHMTLDYIDFYFSLHSLGLLVTNLTETLPFTTIISRLWTLHSHTKTLKFLSATSLKDFNMKKYQNETEKAIFMSYNSIAKVYVKFMIVEILFTGTSYYLKPLGQLAESMSFSNFIYPFIRFIFCVHLLVFFSVCSRKRNNAKRNRTDCFPIAIQIFLGLSDQ